MDSLDQGHNMKYLQEFARQLKFEALGHWPPGKDGTVKNWKVK